ncbi:hypothetical protein [Flavobacterium marginilacus]|uniref:hypothetical protein n=1 Tax=Flavobacterium marginilacus TaxID=3003256 RepID=UPI00248E24B4|nr:hypothetical protein [Flavobacterium marginilacus]
MAQNQARINTDKFGNPYQLIGCKDKKGTGYGVGYIELKGQLYKLEPSPSKKDGVTDWIKVTAIKKRPTHSSM